MNTEIPFEKMLQAALQHGADFAEVFLEHVRTTAVLCDNKRIEHVTSFVDRGIGIRVLKDQMTAFGSTNDLSKRSLLSLVRTVCSKARSKRRKHPPVELIERRAPTIMTVRKHPFGVSLEDKCDLLRRADDIAWQMGDEVRQVRTAYKDVVRRTSIANSRGHFSTDEQVGILFSHQVVAGQEGILQTGLEVVGGTQGFEIFDTQPPEEIAERAAKRAVRLLTARPAPAGQMPVIIAAEAGGTMIHEAVGHGLEGDLACEGLSVYSKRIGERVASELITVIDDATLSGYRGAFSFDDEGTPAHRTTLIQDGILIGYLTDLRTAERFHLPPTGNARRQAYDHLPIVRMTNTFIQSGTSDPASIIADTPSGLFVKRMGGGQVNTINGDFIFDVQEGYLIEGGKIGELVRGATLIGNGPKILCSIDRLGNDLGFSIGTCGKDGQEAPVSCGQPTLRIPEIVVGGTA